MRCDYSYLSGDTVPVKFQSTHLHEVWPFCVNMRHGWDKFQSTHLHEVWQSRENSMLIRPCFNPHTYMRCDPSGLQKCRTISKVSIHTPTWGVTNRVYLLTLTVKFQSTHLHEVWQVFLWDVKTRTMFQSTHLHEVWLRLYFLTLLAYSFNPHTYMRCDINFYILRAYFSSFNPHTYMRCDTLLLSLAL